MLEVLRSRQLSLGPRVPAFEARSPPGWARRTRRRCPPAPRRCTSRCGRWGSGGRRGRHLAVLVRGSRELDPVRARARRCSSTSTRSRSTSTPRRPPRRSRSARPRCCRCTSSATRPTRPALERHGLPIVEDACEALGAVHADGVPVGGRGHPAAFGFYANKQLTTGEGGMLTLGSPEHKEIIDSERNQGRAPDMGWLDHDRLGFNYRLTDIACALGLAQLQRLDDMLAGAGAGGGVVPRGAGRLRGPRAAVRGLRRRRARLVRVRRPAPARRRPRRRRSGRCRSAACSPSRTCPRST